MGSPQLAGNMLLRTREEIENALSCGETAYVSDESEIRLYSPIEITHSNNIVGGKFYSPAQPAFVVKSSGVTFDRVTARGSNPTTYNYDEKLIQAIGTSTAPLTEINIYNSNFSGSAGDNIWLEWVNDAKIFGNTIQDYLYSGIMMLSCDGVHVQGNIIRDAPLSSGVVNTYGIAASDKVNSIAGRSRNISIVQNIVENIEWEGIDTHGGENLAITGNIVTNCVRGIALVVGNSTRLTVPVNITVTGNIIDGRGSTREGISLYGLSGNPADAVITGNRVVGHATPIVTSQYTRSKTYVGGNNVPHVPWTPLTMMNGWKSNSTYTAQYMVDGDTVFVRGMVIPPATFNPTFAAIATAYTPTILTMYRHTKGTNANAGNATVGISTAGQFTMNYADISDMYSYPIDGSYRMI